MYDKLIIYYFTGTGNAMAVANWISQIAEEHVFVLITGLPIVFFSYRIFHWLMKFRFFNWLFAYTSLTKYKFWRRYFAGKRYL